MMSRRTGLAALALVTMCSLFGGWNPVPERDTNLPTMLAVEMLAVEMLAVEVADAAPAAVPHFLMKGGLNPLGDPDGFTEGPGGDHDAGPPDSTQALPASHEHGVRWSGMVAQLLLGLVTRRF